MRGKTVRTTISDKAAPCPLDRVNRQFKAPRPNELWVSDFTYVSTWPASSTWPSSSTSMPGASSAGACQQHCTPTSCSMPWSRRCTTRQPDQRRRSSITATEESQYVSIRYTERLAEAGIEPSVGSVGDSYDNALAETINGLYKAEVIHRRGPWRNFEAVEFATLEWVDWFNHRRLLEPIGNIPPAEAEATLLSPARRASHGGLTQTKRPPAKPGAVHFFN